MKKNFFNLILNLYMHMYMCCMHVAVWLYSRQVMSNCLRPHGLQPTRLLCPWDSPGKNAGVVCHFLLQRIFPIQGLNPGLLHCRQVLYPLSYEASPVCIYLQNVDLAKCCHQQVPNYGGMLPKQISKRLYVFPWSICVLKSQFLLKNQFLNISIAQWLWSTQFCYKISHSKINMGPYGNNSSSSANAKNFLLLLLLSCFSRVQLCATHRQQPTRLPRPWARTLEWVAIFFSNA